jgi:flagellar FliL protein
MAEDDNNAELNEFMQDSMGEEKQKKPRRIIIIGIIVLLILVGGLAGAYFTGKLDSFFQSKTPSKKAVSSGPSKAGKEAGKGKEASENGDAYMPYFYDLPEMLVNLNMTGRKPSYLKIRVSLELSAQSDREKIDSVMPRIIDNFQVYLRELRLEDLQGSSGILRLREELLVRINDAVKPTKVNDVLFKEILVQ